MAKKDEVRTSKSFNKFMKFLDSYENGKYSVYEFEDQSGNLAVHYQLRPELIADKKSATMARIFNTKMAKLKIGEICLAKCICREILQEDWTESKYYFNVDAILKPVCKYEIVQKPYRGVMQNFAVERHVSEWEELEKFHKQNN